MNALFPIVALIVVPAPDEDPVAAAESAFEAGAYDEAAERFGALYDTSGDPVNKYRQAQALRLGERDAEAAEAYELFITDANALLPELEQEARATLTLMIGNAEVQARGCRDRLVPEPEPEPPPAPAPIPEPEPEPQPPPPVVDAPPPPPPPPTLDALEFSLWTSGALTVGAGIAVIATAPLRADAATMQSHDRWTQAQQGARIQQGVGFAIVGAGAALLTGAIVRSIVLHRRHSARSRRARARL